MSGLMKKIFPITIAFFSHNVLNVNSLKCILMNNQECKIRTKIIMSLHFIFIVLV